LFGRGREIEGGGAAEHRRFEEAAGLPVPLQQPFDPLAQRRVGASPVQEGRAHGRVFLFQGFDAERLFLHGAGSYAVGAVSPLNATFAWKMRTESGKKTAGGAHAKPRR